MKKIAFLLILSILTLSFVGCKKDEADNTVIIVYDVDGNGTIEGESQQEIEIGASASTVVAVADPGWIFIGWDDGYAYPSRTDTNVTVNMTYVAIFAEDGSEEGDDSFEDIPDDAPEISEGDNGTGSEVVE